MPAATKLSLLGNSAASPITSSGSTIAKSKAGSATALLEALPNATIIPKHTDSGPDEARTEDINRIYIAVSTDNEAFLKHSTLEIIPEEYSEEHSENYQLHNTVSDSIIINATGAESIMVSLSGKVLITEDFDDMVVFLDKYKTQYRARMADASNSKVRLVMQDVSMAVFIHTMDVAYDSSIEGYANISLEAVAYDMVIDGYGGRIRYDDGIRAHMVADYGEAQTSYTKEEDAADLTDPSKYISRGQALAKSRTAVTQETSLPVADNKTADIDAATPGNASSQLDSKLNDTASADVVPVNQAAQQVPASASVAREVRSDKSRTRGVGSKGGRRR